MIQVSRSNIARNSFSALVALTISYVLFYYLIVAKSRFSIIIWDWSIIKWDLWIIMRDWWISGSAFELVSLYTGFVVLQVMARGRINAWNLYSLLNHSGFALLLLVLSFIGGCSAGKAYQGASALGWIGEGTVQDVVIAHKEKITRGDWVRYAEGDGEFEEWDEYNLWFKSDCCSEIELPNGRTLYGDYLQVSQAEFDERRIGSSISLVELPGEGYPPYRITSYTQSDTKTNIIVTVVTYALGTILIFKKRKVFFNGNEHEFRL